LTWKPNVNTVTSTSDVSVTCHDFPFSIAESLHFEVLDISHEGLLGENRHGSFARGEVYALHCALFPTRLRNFGSRCREMNLMHKFRLYRTKDSHY